jgi:hypothetical protein
MPRQSGACHGCHRLPLGDGPKPPSYPPPSQHARAAVANCIEIASRTRRRWRHLVFLAQMLLHHTSPTEMTHREHIDTSEDQHAKTAAKWNRGKV